MFRQRLWSEGRSFSGPEPHSFLFLSHRPPPSDLGLNGSTGSKRPGPEVSEKAKGKQKGAHNGDYEVWGRWRRGQETDMGLTDLGSLTRHVPHGPRSMGDGVIGQGVFSLSSPFSPFSFLLFRLLCSHTDVKPDWIGKVNDKMLMLSVFWCSPPRWSINCIRTGSESQCVLRLSPAGS